jgi:hypothetical protein
MSDIDIRHLEALTHNYAEFDSRKSGLATALGGVMALLMTLQVFSHSMRMLLGPWWHLQAALIFFMPLLWLPLKQLLFHLLYRGLGPVKAIPDLAYEQAKWRWIFAIALLLMTFQTLVLLGFVSGYANVLRHPETISQLPARIPSVWMSWMWVATLPWLYLLVAPWWIKGVEEARAYLVLVGQGIIWIAFSFNTEGANVSRATRGWLVPAFMAIQLGVFLWALRTINRGCREHRAYKSLLLSLTPKEEQP